MSILLFGGTAEGHSLARRLAQAGLAVTCSVATAYGEAVLEPTPGLTVHVGRMDTDQMAAEMAKGRADKYTLDVRGELAQRTLKKSTPVELLSPLDGPLTAALGPGRRRRMCSGPIPRLTRPGCWRTCRATCS